MTYQISYGFNDLNVNGLVYACWSRNLEQLKKEIADGVDVNSSDPDGVTAITYASNEQGFIDGVRLLLEAGLNPNIKDHEGNTALKILMNSFHRNCVEEKISSTLIRSYGGRYETVTGFRDWLKKLLL